VKRLNVQVQPARYTGPDLSEAVATLSQREIGARITEGKDGGSYVNVDFEVADLSALWESIRKDLRAVPALAAATIVVCEGDQGWDDYLLLHHFDPAEPLDSLL
jgi:hypothetical protein